MEPPNNSSFSVSVVLPASGWEMIAKVLRRLISLTISAAFTNRFPKRVHNYVHQFNVRVAAGVARIGHRRERPAQTVEYYRRAAAASRLVFSGRTASPGSGPPRLALTGDASRRAAEAGAAPERPRGRRSPDSTRGGCRP